MQVSARRRREAEAHKDRAEDREERLRKVVEAIADHECAPCELSRHPRHT
jgi:hypothetical protein